MSTESLPSFSDQLHMQVTKANRKLGINRRNDLGTKKEKKRVANGANAP